MRTDASFAGPFLPMRNCRQNPRVTWMQIACQNQNFRDLLTAPVIAHVTQTAFPVVQNIFHGQFSCAANLAAPETTLLRDGTPQ